MKLRKIISTLLAAVMLCTFLCGCEDLEEFLDYDLSAEPRNHEELLVSHYIDVGQGDCEFIEFPDGKTMLIDAGTSKSSGTIIDYIEGLGYSEINYVIATHPHADHIGGMADVIKYFDIGQIYMPYAGTTTKTFENLLTTIQDKNKKIKTAKAGMNITKSENLDFSVDIIAPVNDEYDDLNNYSVVITIQYGNNRFLYMGDAEKEAEDEILEDKSDVSADVVKAGHHGSKTSSSAKFVSAVGADHAVFSLGEGNDYGHPHSQVVKRWKKAGAEILRTDKNGTIVITSDGNNLTVDTEK